METLYINEVGIASEITLGILSGGCERRHFGGNMEPGHGGF